MSAPLSRRNRGFTLSELMISLAILAVVTVYLTDLFTRQSRAYTVVENVTEVQHNLRAISHLLERELRMTGMLVPEAAAICGVDNTNTADLLYVTDSDALTPGSINDLGARIVSGFGGGSGDALTIANAVLEGDAFYDTDADGTPDSDFQVGGGVIVVDRSNSAVGSVCGIITNVVVGAGNDRLDVVYPVGATAFLGDVVAVPAHVYQVNGQNQLLRDGAVLADNVEDFQFAAFYDTNDNETMDDEALEYPGSDTGAVYQAAAWDNSELREVRVTMVARSRLPDPDFSSGTFQASENRVSPGGTDGFRRRAYTTIVRPRNVGQRQGT
jgi:prepilin-type N-terminal cleavage/methylation domain-containing protein